jgi:hypothetical protein
VEGKLKNKSATNAKKVVREGIENYYFVYSMEAPTDPDAAPAAATAATPAVVADATLEKMNYLFSEVTGPIRYMGFSSVNGITVCLDVPGDIPGTTFTTYLVKLCLVLPRDEKIQIRTSFADPNGTGETFPKLIQNEKDFVMEANIQTEIFGRSDADDGSIFLHQPLCPNVLDCRVYDPIAAVYILRQCKQKEIAKNGDRDEDYFVFSQLLTLFESNPTLRLGVILMPFLRRYTTVSELIQGKPTDYKQSVCTSVWANAIRLLQLGYLHLDMHQKNIMVVEPLQKDSPADIALIDFGLCQRFETLIRKTYNTNSRELTNLMHFVQHTPGQRSELTPGEYSFAHYYQWVFKEDLNVPTNRELYRNMISLDESHESRAEACLTMVRRIVQTDSLFLTLDFGSRVFKSPQCKNSLQVFFSRSDQFLYEDYNPNPFARPSVFQVLKNRNHPKMKTMVGFILRYFLYYQRQRDSADRLLDRRSERYNRAHDLSVRATSTLAKCPGRTCTIMGGRKTRKKMRKTKKQKRKNK